MKKDDIDTIDGQEEVKERGPPEVLRPALRGRGVERDKLGKGGN